MKNYCLGLVLIVLGQSVPRTFAGHLGSKLMYGKKEKDSYYSYMADQASQETGNYEDKLRELDDSIAKAWDTLKTLEQVDFDITDYTEFQELKAQMRAVKCYPKMQNCYIVLRNSIGKLKTSLNERLAAQMKFRIQSLECSARILKMHENSVFNSDFGSCDKIESPNIDHAWENENHLATVNKFIDDAKQVFTNSYEDAEQVGKRIFSIIVAKPVRACMDEISTHSAKPCLLDRIVGK